MELLLTQRAQRSRHSVGLWTDTEFVQNFTPPDFQAKIFTPSISPNFNSFSKKKKQKMSENGEIYTAGNKFYTATGNDGMDKFHLWSGASLIAAVIGVQF